MDLEHNRLTEKQARANAFSSAIYEFEQDAMDLRRGFQVFVALNVFGVGTLLPNDLPSKGFLQASDK
jgi:hypothetical protein